MKNVTYLLNIIVSMFDIELVTATRKNIVSNKSDNFFGNVTLMTASLTICLTNRF